MHMLNSLLLKILLLLVFYQELVFDQAKILCPLIWMTKPVAVNLETKHRLSIHYTAKATSFLRAATKLPLRTLARKQLTLCF